jgi:dTMP kinase
MIVRNFAVFEGGDGSGTSTQIQMLKKRLSENGKKKPVFSPTFEPTDGAIGRIIRSALKKDVSLLPETLARLFAADRGEHLFAKGGVIESCGRGELVISDRYVPSSLVYQGLECGDELPRSLNSAFPVPELLIFFDLDPQIANRRLENRPLLEIYEHLEFQEKVREKYLSLLGEYRAAGALVEVVDASQSVENVADQVWTALSKMPIMKEEEPLTEAQSSHRTYGTRTQS